MRGAIFNGVVCSFLFSWSGAAVAGVIASSTFDSNDEGWRLQNDATTTPTPIFAPAGGNPGGAIQGIDLELGDTWRFVAPFAFRGDLSAAYGGGLSYDLKFDTGASPLNPFDAGFVLIGDGTTTLAYLGATYPTQGVWTHFDVPLSEAGWLVGGAGGPAATAAQMQTVLSNVTSLRIRGEFNSGPDNAFLDNVFLSTAPTSVPEPGTLAILAMGLLAMTRLRRN